MPTPITITLSQAEARALVRAAENTTDYPDAMEAVFPHPSTRAAVERALAKLDAAIQWTIDTITDEQIKALMREADAHGDNAQVEICADALMGFAAARRECVRVIREAEQA